jgi:thiosulfate/3-mercaptopyruvate sulfurtransferase
LAGLAELGLAACGYRAAEPTMPPPDPALDYPASEHFVDAAWLRERLDDPRLRLLDLTPLPVYRAGHIPGAQHVWWQDTIDRNKHAYGMLGDNTVRGNLTRAAGITPESTVVCYDDAGGVYATRLIWMLRYMGFHGARLLVDGRQGWPAHGWELTLERPSVAEGGIGDIFDESINALGPELLERLGEPGLVVLDTRTAAERRETWNDHLRLGQIPGCHWLPRDQFLQPGRAPALIPAGRLRERLTAAGVALERTAEVVVYGLHGTLSSLPYLALLALDDFSVRLYDGAWAEWGAYDYFPVEPLPE